jgi:CspA family cold shock protein
MDGTVKRLIGDKGFGFIRDGSGREYFFHRSEVSGRTFEELREGDQVTFEEASQSPKGPRAANVVKV